jgi:hypothetical protein
MSPRPALVCSGAPRDLGLDQGLRFREVIRAEVERHPRGKSKSRLLSFGLARDPEIARAARDATRFYPHMAERAEGIARGARVSPGDLAALLAGESRQGQETLVGVRSEAWPAGVSIALSTRREAPLFVRSSRPENGYRSLEIAIPWRVPALAGVNQHGLAVAASGLSPASGSPSSCAAPAAFLVQDCLQRFDGVDKALEWCERRPAGGCASILLADAEGLLARIDLQDERRQVHREMDGILLGAGEPARIASVDKACRASEHLDAEALRGILAISGASVFLLDPADPERIFGDLPWRS